MKARSNHRFPSWPWIASLAHSKVRAFFGEHGDKERKMNAMAGHSGKHQRGNSQVCGGKIPSIRVALCQKGIGIGRQEGETELREREQRGRLTIHLNCVSGKVGTRSRDQPNPSHLQ